LTHGYLLTLAREPKQSELTRMQAFLQQQRDAFTQDSDSTQKLLNELQLVGDPVEQAAWITVASVLLNLDEFIVRE